MDHGKVINPQQDDTLIAGFVALAVCIHILEAAIPSPIPGIKPGLANVVTLLVLLRYGWKMAVWVGLLRVLVGSLLIGSFLTPTFMLSGGGALMSLLALGAGVTLNRILPGAGLGPIGLSLLAALAHMSGQLLLARWLFIPHDGLFALAPPLLTAALVFGIASGWIAGRILAELPARPHA